MAQDQTYLHIAVSEGLHDAIPLLARIQHCDINLPKSASNQSTPLRWAITISAAHGDSPRTPPGLYYCADTIAQQPEARI